MTDDQTRVARYLALAGIAPPWVALGFGLVSEGAWAGFAALTYGAVIVSFVCGMHWGLFMQPRGPMPINLLITSNVGALAAWAMLLISMWSATAAFLGLAACLALLLQIDRRLLGAGTIAPWFWRLRRDASLGLGVAMLIWSVLG